MGLLPGTLAAGLLDPGISETLARERAASITAVRYDLAITIPSAKSEPVRGKAVLSFRLRNPQDVILDFAQSREKILDLRANDAGVNFDAVNGHVVVPRSSVHAGENSLSIEFATGDGALNRNDDYLYTLFVPARAHLAFPCFDQPDIKARFRLALTLPEGWVAVANGAAVDGGGSRTVKFSETHPLPTYLFAFAAGKFRVATAERNGRTMRMFHRETDDAKVARNSDALFDLHAKALAWLEDYTRIAYPWDKLDFVLLPAFQFGGMEHAGAIYYSAPAMMLEPSATQNQILQRASTISHEVAHMWFGDLVTMRWFNDVWTKEVFANFIAAKIVNPSFPEVNHELRFLLSHYPSAYDVDRTRGANPIRQPLANLNDAGTLYGNIIYDKAPIVMRQLEAMLGDTNLRDGLREYLETHSYGNATWPDLIGILDRRTAEDLAKWSRTWVEERGRPVLSMAWNAGTIAVTQRDPMARPLLWPQTLRITLGYPDQTLEVTAFTRRRRTVIKAPSNIQPLYMLANGGGMGYGLCVLDDASKRYLLDHVQEIRDPLTRGAAWVTLWENMVDRGIAPDDLGRAVIRALPLEADEQIAQQLLGYLTRLFWFYLPLEDRLPQAHNLEVLLRTGIARAPNASGKSAWFSAFRSIALSSESLAWIERLWRREETIDGLPFTESDEITMALELAVKQVPGGDRIVSAQRERTRDLDRKQRLAFVMPAASADPAEREHAFERFKRLENRAHEPWVLESLRYLHHPLREEHARRFIAPSLDLFVEIQATGDIFFPKRWLDATLANHRSAEAASAVRAYLEEQKALPQRLRWFVEASADNLLRSVQDK